MMSSRFMLGGILAVVSSRIYKHLEKYDPKNMDEIIKLNLYVD